MNHTARHFFLCVYFVQFVQGTYENVTETVELNLQVQRYRLK
jgi:hypothetical protein